MYRLLARVTMATYLDTNREYHAFFNDDNVENTESYSSTCQTSVKHVYLEQTAWSVGSIMR